MKKEFVIINVSKIILLSFFLSFLYLITSLLFSLSSGGTGISGVKILLIVSLLQTSVLSYTVIHSKWSGWKLILAIFFVFFGVTTFLTQIETIVFLKNVVPAEIVPVFFIQGFIVAGIFSPVTVAFHGKIRGKINLNLHYKPLKDWIWKLILLAVCYVIIYFSSGLFIFMPLAGEAFQEFYSDLQMPTWILPLQFVRGIIFGLIAIPVIQMEPNRIAVPLLFSVLMGSLLLLPNPFMPDIIRMAHLAEITASNFLFGWITVSILRK